MMTSSYDMEQMGVRVEARVGTGVEQINTFV